MINFLNKGGTNKVHQTLEYIQCIGNQYIDTGIAPWQSHKFEMKFSISSAPTSDICLFGGQYGNNANNLGVFYRSNTLTISYGGISSTFSETLPLNTSITLTLENKGLVTITYNDISKIHNLNSTGGFGGDHKNVYIAALNDNNTAVKKANNLSIQEFNIYQSNTLLHNLIPCKISNLIMMYDKVTCTYFLNKGTGNFIAGTEL